MKEVKDLMLELVRLCQRGVHLPLVIGALGAFIVIPPGHAESIPLWATSAAAPTLASTAPTRSTSALKPFDQASLQTTVTQAASELLIPGAVVFLRTPQGDFTVNHGTTQLGITTAPSVDTHFRIASNTKTMTAAIIMQLAQEGKLSLEDPISKYVAGVPNGDNITLAQLLEMRSGLYNFTDAPEIAASIDREPTRVWTPEELLAIAFKRAPDAPPGKEFQYDNTNYVLLGLVIEKIEGKPLATVMHDRLFKPLGMNGSLLPSPTQNEIPQPFSHGYLYGSASVALSGTPPYTSEEKAAARAGTLLPKDYTNVNHSFATAAGGAVSTAKDLSTWIRALVTGEVLNPDSQRRWLNSIQPEDPKNPAGTEYGYGIARMHWGPNAYLYHGGETPGFNSFIGHDTTNNVTLVVWTNSTVSLEQSPTANSLMIKVLDHIYSVSPLAPAPATKKDSTK